MREPDIYLLVFTVAAMQLIANQSLAAVVPVICSLDEYWNPRLNACVACPPKSSAGSDIAHKFYLSYCSQYPTCCSPSSASAQPPTYNAASVTSAAPASFTSVSKHTSPVDAGDAIAIGFVNWKVVVVSFICVAVAIALCLTLWRFASRSYRRKQADLDSAVDRSTEDVEGMERDPTVEGIGTAPLLPNQVAQGIIYNEAVRGPRPVYADGSDHYDNID